jgi:hypothetical protein
MRSGASVVTPPDETTVDGFDPDRILATLQCRGVEFVVIGGLAARARGAMRPTMDVDVVAATDDENLGRLAGALIELDARLRVAGMSDEEARRLPVKLDAITLRNFGSSTWATDAGPLDVLVELRDATGGRCRFEDLEARADAVEFGGLVVLVAALNDIIASKEFADREKDREALPELRRLRDEQS